jgi:hypothetical protein
MSQAAIEFEDLHVDEEWRDIPNYPGYQASSLGRIKGSALNNFSPTFGYKNNKGYMACNVIVSNKLSCMEIHRQVLLSFTDGPKPGEQCDHINRDKTDNRICNLRWATVSENLKNRNNWGQFSKGVRIQKQRYKRKDGSIVYSISYQARISVNGKQINIGSFKTEEEAHQAFLKAFKEHQGYHYIE